MSLLPVATSTEMSSSLPLAVAAIVPVAGGAVLPMSMPVEAAIVQVQGGAVYQEVVSAYAQPMSAEQALATAEAEGLFMPPSNGKTGFRGVTHVTGKKARPFQAWVCREGKLERLGRFATPEEAALCRARTPEGQKAASRCAAPRHMCARPPGLRARSTRPALSPARARAPLSDAHPAHNSPQVGAWRQVLSCAHDARGGGGAGGGGGGTGGGRGSHTGALGEPDWLPWGVRQHLQQGEAVRGACLCRRQGGTDACLLALRRLLSAPEPAAGCPKPRPASVNLGQPRSTSASLGLPRPHRAWFRHRRVCGRRAA